jgi:hypothetical protein
MEKVFAEPTNYFPDDIKEVNWISAVFLQSSLKRET